jgi:1-phosphatidylinositol phosphodiesterase
MSQQLIATVVSEASPLEGQKNRSSENFEFLALPTPTTSVTGQVSGNPNAASIDASIFRDINNRVDQIVGQISNGQVVITQELEMGDKYYIASPANAGSAEFTVSFYGNI